MLRNGILWPCEFGYRLLVISGAAAKFMARIVTLMKKGIHLGKFDHGLTASEPWKS